MIDNRYEIIERLGSPGSYAEVYMALDTAVRDANQPLKVVIKALNPYLQGVPDSELERKLVENFRNEAVALDRVRHAHIINRLGHGTAIDLAGRTFHYLVLEYMGGGDLAALCRSHALPINDALNYIEQICAGLAFAHSRGVIHRDIKPHNILFTADRRIAKIADFGVAKIKFIDSMEGAITRVGSDIYAPPEHHPLALPFDGAQVPGDANALMTLTPAADIYSLAKTIYMVLCGESPRGFSQRAISELPLYVRHQPWADAVLAVLGKATQSNPAARFQTVEDFWQAFNAAVTSSRSVTANAYAPDNFATDNSVTRPLAPANIANTVGAQLPPGSAFPASANPNRNGNRIIVDLSSSNDFGKIGEYNNQPPAIYSDESLPAPQHFNRPSLAQRARRLLVALLLITLCGVMFYAYYFFSANATNNTNASNTRRQTANAPTPNNAQTPSPVGREFVTTNDVKLRRASNANAQQIGLAKKDSRVKVISEENGWYQVTVVEYGAPKTNSNFSDQGWLNKAYVRQR